MVETCPGCEYKFEREDGFFLGAFVVNFAVTEAALGVFMVISLALTLPDPPTVALAIAGALVVIMVPMAFYPFSRTIWAAIDLMMQRAR